MAMLPQSLVASLMNQQLLGNQGVAYLGELDGQMKQIMDDRNTPPDIKAKKYGHVLNKFLEMRGNELKDASSVQIPEGVRSAPSLMGPSQPVDEEELLRTVSQRNKAKARVLLEHVRRNPDIEWNSQSQLVYKGVPVGNSNVADLLNQFSRPGHRNELGFSGWKEFAQALNEHNTPRTAIGNKQLLGRAAESEDDLFVSPQSVASTSALQTPPAGSLAPKKDRRSRVFTRSRGAVADSPGEWNQYRQR